MAERPLARVLVVGGGTAGWMAAATLATLLPALAVTLVESDAIGAVGVGEATIPQINLLNAMLGIADADMLRDCEATWKLGIVFDGWGAPDERYIHPFGAFGAPCRGVDFTPAWLRARAEGFAAAADRYTLNAAAAWAGRYAPPGRKRSDAPPLFAAWHFDAALYARLLRRVAEARGVTRVEGIIARVERVGEPGDVAAVHLSDGRALTSDLYLDCSGFRSLLLGQALGEPFLDWSAQLPCDRAIAQPTARTGPPVPYTRSTAHGAGWTWRIPLQHRTGNGIVYSSAHLHDDDAEAELRRVSDGEPLGEPRRLRFIAGRRARSWRGNVVALGLAAGFLEPLESTAIHLVQSGLTRLVTLLPTTLPAPTAELAFNRATAEEYEGIRDFLHLHYYANRRDEPFWRERRESEPSPALRERIALFRATGRVVRAGDELFSEDSWRAVMMGQGIEPVGWGALAAALPRKVLERHMTAVETAVAARVGAMPAHEDAIAAERARATALGGTGLGGMGLSAGG